MPGRPGRRLPLPRPRRSRRARRPLCPSRSPGRPCATCWRGSAMLEVRELLIAQLDKEISTAPAPNADGYIDEIEGEAATLRESWSRMFAAAPALPTVPVFLAQPADRRSRSPHPAGDPARHRRHLCRGLRRGVVVSPFHGKPAPPDGGSQASRLPWPEFPTPCCASASSLLGVVDFHCGDDRHVLRLLSRPRAGPADRDDAGQRGVHHAPDRARVALPFGAQCAVPAARGLG